MEPIFQVFFHLSTCPNICFVGSSHFDFPGFRRPTWDSGEGTAADDVGMPSFFWDGVDN